MAPIARFAGRRLDPGFIRQDLRHHQAETAPELIALYRRLAALGERWRCYAWRRTVSVSPLTFVIRTGSPLLIGPSSAMARHRSPWRNT